MCYLHSYTTSELRFYCINNELNFYHIRQNAVSFYFMSPQQVKGYSDIDGSVLTVGLQLLQISSFFIALKKYFNQRIKLLDHTKLGRSQTDQNGESLIKGFRAANHTFRQTTFTTTCQAIYSRDLTSQESEKELKTRPILKKYP